MTDRAVGAALIALAIVLPLVRQSGAPSWDTIWAEDGSIYFQEAHDHGGGEVLFRGFAGYLQLPPRLLATMAVHVRLDDLDLFLAVSSVLVCALLAWFMYWASAGWVTSRPVRVVLASLVVLSPAMGQENTANITNTIWVFAAVAPWALIAKADTPAALCVRVIVAFLAATATAMSVVFLPLALAQVAMRKSRDALVVPAAFCVGLVLQFAVVLNTSDGGHPRPAVRRLARFAGLLDVRVFAEYLIGDKGIRALWADYRAAIIIGAPVCVVLILALVFRGAGRSNQLLSCVFLAYAVVTFFVPVWGRGTNVVTVADREVVPFTLDAPPLDGFLLPSADAHYTTIAMRFSVVPVVMLASAIAVLVASPHRPPSGFATAIRVVFVAHIAAVILLGLVVSNARSRGPEWSDALTRTYREHCVDQPPATTVNVRTPTGLFAVSLRCDEIPRAAPG